MHSAAANNMATIQFRLSSRVSNCSAELLVRFYEGTAAFRAKSRIYVPTDLWDATTQHLMRPRSYNLLSEVTDTNARIDALYNHILHQWSLDRYAANPPSWLQTVIDTMQQVAAPSSGTVTLLDCVRAYADARRNSPNTYKNINTLARTLSTYNHPINIAAITSDYIRAFADYLYSYLSPNTAKKMLSSLRSVCNTAIDNNQLSHSPFGRNGYTIGAPVYGSPQYLTIEERDYLTTFPNLPTKLAVQRDIFIFQCHTGCRVSDLVQLTRANIIKDAEGELCLQYIPHKTISHKANSVIVPLSKQAQEIISRYTHTRLIRGLTTDTRCYCAEYIHDPAYLSPTLLPFISTPSYNECIHQIFTIAGLTRPIVDIDKHTGQPTTTTLDAIATSHLARKTFSQMVYSRSGSERIAASFTGHSPNSRAFSRYNEVSISMKRAIIDQN